ncbi:hypothetical protein Hanom_Chr11g01045161 [Helianthus anomalus]
MMKCLKYPSYFNIFYVITYTLGNSYVNSIIKTLNPTRDSSLSSPILISDYQ